MSDYTFPSNYNLLHSHEFDAVFDSRDFSVSSRSFLILAKRNARGFNRLGMIISKKNLARAVDRNKVKRRVREAFRHLSRSASLDLVVLARPGIRHEDDLAGMVSGLFSELLSKAEVA